jgi:hypothetical protein
MLDSILDDFYVRLLIAGCGETLDATNCVIHKVIYQILVSDLLFVDYLCSKPNDDLAVIYEASLHNLA